MNYAAINATVSRNRVQAENRLVQSEVCLAKQIQAAHAGVPVCSWTQALGTARNLLAKVDATILAR